MPPPQRGPRPNPVSDIDRFLQEVDRLRRKASDDAQQAPARQPQWQDTRGDDDVIEVLPADAPPAPPPAVARPRKPRRYDDVEVVTPAQPTRPSPVVSQAPSSSGFAPSPVSTVATVATVATVQTIATIAAPRAAGQSTRGPSDNAVKVVALLRGNVRSAMLLREIFDAPLSRRRRRS